MVYNEQVWARSTTALVHRPPLYVHVVFTSHTHTHAHAHAHTHTHTHILTLVLILTLTHSDIKHIIIIITLCILHLAKLLGSLHINLTTPRYTQILHRLHFNRYSISMWSIISTWFIISPWSIISPCASYRHHPSTTHISPGQSEGLINLLPAASCFMTSSFCTPYNRRYH